MVLMVMKVTTFQLTIGYQRFIFKIIIVIHVVAFKYEDFGYYNES